MSPDEPIIVTSTPVSAEVLRRLVGAFFDDMVKFEVDLGTGRIAVGGELHADGEALLLEQGSRQEDLWGGNFYPDRAGDDRIEFTSLINIRPSQGNRSMLIESLEIRIRVRSLALALLAPESAE
ncbi:MAG: DUF5674 family protein [Acidobacteriota bacterium]